MLHRFLLMTLVPFAYGCPNIISRSEWGAAAPKRVTNLQQNPAPYIVVHHSDTPTCNNLANCKTRVKNIQSYHMNHNGWDDIGYNFLVGADGNIYEGRGFGKSGAHVPKYNSRSIGICVIGTFSRVAPSQVQLDAVKSLISCAESSNKVTSNYHLIGHRQGKQTTCPGDALFNIIKTWPHFDSSIRP